MSGRPVQKRADVEAIKAMWEASGRLLDLRPVIAYSMWKCGCTFKEISEVFGITRQMAETLTKSVDKKLQ